MSPIRRLVNTIVESIRGGGAPSSLAVDADTYGAVTAAANRLGYKREDGQIIFMGVAITRGGAS